MGAPLRQPAVGCSPASIPTFDHVEALRAVAAGETMASVGRRYGVTRERVRQIVREAGVSPARGWSELRAKRAKVLNAVALGMTDVEIAQRLGLTLSTVEAERRAHGVRRLAGKGAQRLRTVITVPDWVPDDLTDHYRELAACDGEEAAASECRRLKRARNA